MGTGFCRGLIEKRIDKEPALEQKSLPSPKSKKLSYKEQKELDGMESSITALETEIEAMHHCEEKSLETYHLLGEAQQRLDALYDRWQYLTASES